MGKRVTIQEIADELGISRNTVSKAINNSGKLAEATRERILQKAVEMGYKQFSYFNSMSALIADQAASRPAPGETRDIAVLTGMFLSFSHFASLMLDRFQQEISVLGFSMSTHRVRPEHMESGVLPASFRREQTAAILCIEIFDRKYAEMICGLGIPVLFVDCPAFLNGDSFPADLLMMDNMTEMGRLTAELLRRGRTRIGFVGNHAHCQSFLERYSAFRLAMFLNHAPVDDRQCVLRNEGDEIRRQIQAMESLPEVFLCANDFVAIDVLDALRDMGKTVPEDIWVCGFDDAPESRRMAVPLTTIHIHTQIMAFSAVQMLTSRMKEPNLDYRIVHTQTELFFRDSTGDRAGDRREGGAP